VPTKLYRGTRQRLLLSVVDWFSSMPLARSVEDISARSAIYRFFILKKRRYSCVKNANFKVSERITEGCSIRDGGEICGTIRGCTFANLYISPVPKAGSDVRLSKRYWVVLLRLRLVPLSLPLHDNEVMLTGDIAQAQTQNDMFG